MKFFTEEYLKNLRRKCQESHDLMDADEYLDKQLAKGVPFHDVIIELSKAVGMSPEYIDEHSYISNESIAMVQKILNDVKDDIKSDGYFAPNSSLYGLRFNDYAHLSRRDKKKLAGLMARIMERAYRRGVQQALFLQQEGVIPEKLLSNLYAYRYETPLEISQGLDGFRMSSLERLFIEENLEQIGFER